MPAAERYRGLGRVLEAGPGRRPVRAPASLCTESALAALERGLDPLAKQSESGA